MKPTTVLLGIAVSLLLAGEARAAEPLGPTATVQAAPATATGLAPAAAPTPPTAAAAALAACSNVYDFFATDCPLTW